VETIDSHRPPLSICLIRHGLSTANVDEKVYLQMPDHVIPLVNPRDDPILLEAGRSLASLGMPPHDTVAWYSPYLRTKQTMDIVLAAAFGDQAQFVQKKESFLLREQEFGDWNTLTEVEMEKENPRRFIALKQAKDVYNKFYFRCPNSFLPCTFAASARARAPSNSSTRSHCARYPNGESRADVAQRVTLFTSKFFRGSKQHHTRLFLSVCFSNPTLLPRFQTTPRRVPARRNAARYAHDLFQPHGGVV
jgi:broad specificity phosphatase PhoE